ncbi:MAG: 2-oxoacid:ferredoxin oxidoreductase subunit beta [Synergistaceae bacterium]|jgi:2-oxoglutarate ferredoxin oxidoreductase subunit beta|nr:2-oxoacid:ferredoxin oxidoreductase subunit beta [Synergistaceae bacterium]
MNSITRAFEKAGVTLNDTVLVSGIGCWGHVDSFLKVNAFHGTHGRALAFATGIKLANPELNVVVALGDGDGVTIGGNHFIHACRRNIDLTAILCNNYNYGMTGGQYSSTTPEHSITSTSPYGHIEPGFDICKLAEVSGARYIARSISENVTQTAEYIAEAMSKKGFSFVEVLTPCTTHYGRNNAMKHPPELYRWLKSTVVPAAAAAKMTEDQLRNKFIIGKLYDRPGQDYGTRYRDEIQAKGIEDLAKKE